MMWMPEEAEEERVMEVVMRYSSLIEIEYAVIAVLM